MTASPYKTAILQPDHRERTRNRPDQSAERKGNGMDNETIVNKLKAGQGNREQLLEMLWTRNLGLIRKLIHGMTGLEHGKWSDKQDFEDLEQQAFLGILRAIPVYDSTKGTKFFTIASDYIKVSIYRYYDKAGQSVRIPEYMRYRIRDYTRERDRQIANGEPATDESIKKALRLTDNSFRSIKSAMRKMNTESLDKLLDENNSDSGTVLDMIAGSENVSDTALAGSYEKDLHNLLQSAIRELPDRERTVLHARHYQRMSTAWIARTLHCSPQYVSQLAQSAYKKIRTGKYSQELLSFLPEKSMAQAKKRIQNDFKELSDQERDLLL